MLMCMGFRTRTAFSINTRIKPFHYCSFKHSYTNIARFASSKSTTTLAASGDDSKNNGRDNNIKETPTSYKGASHSSSDFVTHFIAGPDNNFTTAQAIGTVMRSSLMDKDDTNAMPPENEITSVSATVDDEDTVVLVGRDNLNLTPLQLLTLGSVWFLPAGAPRDPSLGGKPKRLTVQDATRILDEGDYLRVHHTPRRFPAVYDFSWDGDDDGSIKNDGTASTNKPSVIVASDAEKGYIVINKPAGVPVHCTVDNALENVADCLRTSLVMAKKRRQTDADINVNVNTPTKKSQKDKEDDLYVSTPQRLDQNTSGLLVVATRKVFASYYAKILRHKTDKQLVVSSKQNDGNNNDDTARQGGIHKEYRCLVCLNEPQHDAVNNNEITDPSSPWSVLGALESLKQYAADQTVIRHYLEPSIRAPKNFARVPGNESWAESLLRIKKVGDLYPLVGSNASKNLANSLWSDPEAVPPGCKAVVELEIELLTGRTHQIRGQLSTEGFPLVGDAQYGGAIPGNTFMPPNTSFDDDGDGEVSTKARPPYGYARFDKLALQCSQLEFLDPNIVLKDDGTEVGRISDRWNVFRLEDAWWTPDLVNYQQQMSSSSPLVETNSVPTDASDEMLVRELKNAATSSVVRDHDSKSYSPLPPNILLTPGVHKYVLVKATKYSSSNDTAEIEWFVKSASPEECGGPYHANVAQGLVEELQRKGYDVTVTGGGRIDYNEYAPHAHVYGFSYGFGKGDHAKAASIIESSSKNTIIATFDNSNTLY